MESSNRTVSICALRRNFKLFLVFTFVCYSFYLGPIPPNLQQKKEKKKKTRQLLAKNILFEFFDCARLLLASAFCFDLLGCVCVIKSPVESIMNKLLSPWKPTSVRTLTNLWPEVKTVYV